MSKTEVLENDIQCLEDSNQVLVYKRVVLENTIQNLEDANQGLVSKNEAIENTVQKLEDANHDLVSKTEALKNNVQFLEEAKHVLESRTEVMQNTLQKKDVVVNALNEVNSMQAQLLSQYRQVLDSYLELSKSDKTKQVSKYKIGYSRRNLRSQPKSAIPKIIITAPPPQRFKKEDFDNILAAIPANNIYVNKHKQSTNITTIAPSTTYEKKKPYTSSSVVLTLPTLLKPHKIHAIPPTIHQHHHHYHEDYQDEQIEEQNDTEEEFLQEQLELEELGFFNDTEEDHSSVEASFEVEEEEEGGCDVGSDSVSNTNSLISDISVEDSFGSYIGDDTASDGFEYTEEEEEEG